MDAESGFLLCAIIRVNYEDRDKILLRNFSPAVRMHAVNIHTITFWQSILQVEKERERERVSVEIGRTL